jgi:hypothetical protein
LLSPEQLKEGRNWRDVGGGRRFGVVGCNGRRRKEDASHPHPAATVGDPLNTNLQCLLSQLFKPFKIHDHDLESLSFGLAFAVVVIETPSH